MAITAIIDIYLDHLVETSLNNNVGRVEGEMADPTNNPSAEWQKWLPVESTVTRKDVQELEALIGHVLPQDYVAFLSHKHFYALYIYEASFCRHPVRTWKRELQEMIFNGYPREYLIDRGWVPFADWSDWGLLCFDTTQKQAGSDYPVVLWDHEVPDKITPQQPSFFQLMKQLDEDHKIHNEP